MKIFVIIYLLFILLFSSHQYVFSQDYFPLEAGNFWRYSTSICVHGDCDWGARNVEVTYDTLINNRKYFNIEGWFFDEDFFYRSDSAGLYFVTQSSVIEYQLLDYNSPQFTSHQVGYLDWTSHFQFQDTISFFDGEPQPVRYYGIDAWPFSYLSFELMKDIGVISFTDLELIGDSGGSLRGCIISGIPYGIYVEVEEDNIPTNFSLFQNYPNPFNPTTTIEFVIPNLSELKSALHTKLIVYDVLGREVKTLINQPMKPGNHKVEFNASEFASGVYFYKLTAGSFIDTKKLVLIK